MQSRSVYRPGCAQGSAGAPCLPLTGSPKRAAVCVWRPQLAALAGVVGWRAGRGWRRRLIIQAQQLRQALDGLRWIAFRGAGSEAGGQ